MNGMSVAIINTEKGLNLFEKSKKYLNYCERTTDDCIQPNLVSATKKGKRYRHLKKDYSKKGIEYVIDKYVHYGPGGATIRRIRRKIIRCIYK